MQNFIDYRVFFTKTDECRFVGHLDVSRIITRAIQKAKIPVWKTQGFNQRTYITFSNPLSLGFSSLCESFDFRIVDETYDISLVPDLINNNLPAGIRMISCEKPKYKSSEITSADFLIKIYSDDISNTELYNVFKSMMDSDEIIVEKKTKKGVKNINLADYYSSYDIEIEDDVVKISINLPSGGQLNVNPQLFITKAETDNNIEIYSDITRLKMMVNEDGFR